MWQTNQSVFNKKTFTHSEIALSLKQINLENQIRTIRYRIVLLLLQIPIYFFTYFIAYFKKLDTPRGCVYTAHMKNNKNKESEIDVALITKRIKNIQGQLSGISHMVEDGKDCVAVVTQLKASRAGIERVLEIFLESNLRNCISSSLSEKKKKEVKAILAELTK